MTRARTRRKMLLLMRSVAFTLAIILILSVLCSCKESKSARKYCEIEIVLPESFEDYQEDKVFDAAYTDGELIVGIQRLSFDAGLEDGVPATLTPKSFAGYYLKRTETKAEILEHGYVPYAIFTMETGLGAYDYLLSFYRTDYAYFIITFIAVSPISDYRYEEIFGYIDTVVYRT